MRRKFRESNGDSNSDIDFNANLKNNRFKILLIAGSIAVGAFFVYLFIITRDLPSLQQLEDYKPKLASKVYSADMKIIHEYYEQKRSFVPLEEMPEILVQAVIATEDRRFYEHWGM